jgi:spermidine synthase
VLAEETEGAEMAREENSHEVAAPKRVGLAIIGPLFCLSGGTALLYQVAFGKKLSTIFGATAYAISAVLAAFMGGLALGSWLGGSYGARVRRPLVVYGVAEIVVGAVCALTPALFDGLASLYVSMVHTLPSSLAAVSALRAVIAAAVVLAPTVAMGVTLPMLARLVAGAAGESSRRRLGTLYALNTAGGAVGALASAYLVLPALGVRSTMQAAAVVNLAIGAAAIALGRRAEVAPEAKEAPAVVAERGADLRLYTALAVASGLLVFSSEVVDTHLLALLIGNSAYAFGLMLAVFLTCLSLGAALAPRIDRRLGEHALVVSLFATGAALLLMVPVWAKLPGIFTRVGEGVQSWMVREAVRGGAALLVLALPTVCMGVTFPLLLRRVAGRADVAAAVGRLTAINTMGSILGSLVSGYLILPWLGSERMLKAVALAFVACGVLAAVWREGRPVRPHNGVLGGVVAAAALALLMPGWDMKVMTNGANVYFSYRNTPDELVYVAEDVHGGLTSVAREGQVLTMYTNGKFQGDNWFEVTAQRSFAHFPCLFVGGFDSALVIGLGTGTTLGTLAAYPFKELHVVEISPSIVEAAGRYFSEPNRNALQDPRVTLALDDGRNVLLTSRQQFDLVTIEVSSVWFAGAANLYSTDFYALVASKLTDGGVMQQWVQLHHIGWRELAVTLHSMRTAFPHVALFVSGNQGIVVAAKHPLVASRSHLAELSAIPEVAQTLGDVSTLEELMSRMVISDEELDQFVVDGLAQGPGPTLSTDENLYLEYATPKGNVMSYEKSLYAMFDQLAKYKRPDVVEQHLTPL